MIEYQNIKLITLKEVFKNKEQKETIPRSQSIKQPEINVSKYVKYYHTKTINQGNKGTNYAYRAKIWFFENICICSPVRKI